MEVKQLTAKTLISRLSSVSDQTRTAALSELRLLTKNDPDIRPIIANNEAAIPYLADTLYSPVPLLQENAAATLLNLSITCPKSLISTRGLLDALSHALSNHHHHHPTAVQASAATVYSLLIDETHRPTIGAKRDLVYALIDIVKTPNSPPQSIKDALKALFVLSLYPQNRQTMVELGAATVLFTVVVTGGKIGLTEDATAVIAQIGGCEGAPSAFRKVSGVRVLVDLVDTGTGSSTRVRENAVSGLLNLVTWGGEEVEDEIRDVGLEIVFVGLRDVARNGSSKGRKRAESLINILDGRNGFFKGLNDDSSSDLYPAYVLDSDLYVQ